MKMLFFLIVFTVKVCKSVQPPRHGFIVPPVCSEEPKFGTNCTVGCESDFKMSNKKRITSCTANGEWSLDPSELGTCSGIF